MNYEHIIDEYNDLRSRCHTLACENSGALMGADSWLRHALWEEDITLSYTSDGINCHGMTYTSQTMSNESFDFTIPFELIEK